MAEHSNIEWTDHTFNPWIGCQHVLKKMEEFQEKDDDELLVIRRKVLWWPAQTGDAIKAIGPTYPAEGYKKHTRAPAN